VNAFSQTIYKYSRPPTNHYASSQSQSLDTSKTSKYTSIEQWYRSHGILGTSQISLCTTEKSVGGRGLFWNSVVIPQTGEILAFIPAECLVTKSNILESFPDLKSMDVEHEDDDDLDSNQNSEVSWQAKLATYARHCLDMMWCVPCACGLWV
jgi:hypothetical protein